MFNKVLDAAACLLGLAFLCSATVLAALEVTKG